MGISLDELLLDNSSAIKIQDTAGDELDINADGSLNVAFAPGAQIEITDGTDTLAINADGSINVNLTDDGIADGAADSGNPFKVGGRAVSGALTAVDNNDRYDLLGDLYRRTWVNTSRNIAMLNSAATVTTTAAQVLVSALAGRREVTIQNEGSSDVYLGSSAGVTSSNGVKISKNASATFEIGPDVAIFMVAASGSQSVRFLELA